MAQRDLFEFHYTCTRIDEALDNAEYSIRFLLGLLIDELRPEISVEEKAKLLDIWSRDMVSELKGYFTEVSLTNAEMRNAANLQLAEMDRQIRSLEAEVEELSARLEGASGDEGPTG